MLLGLKTNHGPIVAIHLRPSIRAKANEAAPSETTKDDLAFALYYLATVSDTASAKDYFTRSVEIWTDLSYRHPQNRSYDKRKAMAERALKELK